MVRHTCQRRIGNELLCVVVTVPAPAPSVHDVLVARPGDAFHRDDLDAAGRETTRLKYLVKLVDEARGRKHALAGEGADAD